VLQQPKAIKSTLPRLRVMSSADKTDVSVGCSSSNEQAKHAHVCMAGNTSRWNPYDDCEEEEEEDEDEDYDEEDEEEEGPIQKEKSGAVKKEEVVGKRQREVENEMVEVRGVHRMSEQHGGMG
jgi:hypothetical protein